MRILLIVTSTAAYPSGLETGLWLSELTHMYDLAKKQGHQITIASPKGGKEPVDPESLKPMLLDKLSKTYWEDATFKKQLHSSKSIETVEDESFDLVYLAGGHGCMYDFPHDPALQKIIRQHFENKQLIASICHGTCGLLNVILSSDSYMIKGKKLTGFNWFEESLARRKNQVPFNLEHELIERGANYSKALIPMTSHVVVDDNLITGQNPFSSIEMANVVVQELMQKK